MRSYVFLALLLLLSSQHPVYIIDLDDIGIGDIWVPPLSTVTRTGNFTSDMSGEAKVEITIYSNESCIVEVTINGVSARIAKQQATITVGISKHNKIEIRATNTRLHGVTIYGNSTLKIIFSDNEPRQNHNMLGIAFLLSIIIPPVLIVAIRRKTRATLQNNIEEVIASDELH